MACNKDKYTTKPQLEFKKINGNVFPKNSELKMVLNVTDKEGDLTDTLFIYKLNKNCMKDTLKLFYKMPTFPTNTNLQTELLVNYTYGINGIYPSITLSSKCNGNQNDTCTFKFIIKDKAGNKSDSVVSPQLVLLK